MRLESARAKERECERGNKRQAERVGAPASKPGTDGDAIVDRTVVAVVEVGATIGVVEAIVEVVAQSKYTFCGCGSDIKANRFCGGGSGIIKQINICRGYRHSHAPLCICAALVILVNMLVLVSDPSPSVPY